MHSIGTGLAFGFVFYVLIRVILGKYRRAAPLLWITFPLYVLHLLLHTLQIQAIFSGHLAISD